MDEVKRTEKAETGRHAPFVVRGLKLVLLAVGQRAPLASPRIISNGPRILNQIPSATTVLLTLTIPCLRLLSVVSLSTFDRQSFSRLSHTSHRSAVQVFIFRLFFITEHQ